MNKGEEQIKATQMIYDPIWCIWKPKSKHQFIRKLGKAIAESPNLLDMLPQSEKQTEETKQHEQSARESEEEAENNEVVDIEGE